MNILFSKQLLRLFSTNIRNFNATLSPKRKLLRNGVFFVIGTTLLVHPIPLTLDNLYWSYESYFWASIRFLRSLRIGIEITFDYYISTVGMDPSLHNYGPMISRVHQRSASRILDGCLKNGGTYIKLGQGLVSLSHILPEEYIETLTQLQDKCLTRGPDEMPQMMMEDFGKKPEELFASIESEPLAAASLAQVYRGVTMDGEEVAIKVQYMDLQSRFVSDVATIDFLLKIIGFVHPDFNFGWVLTDLSERLKYELDFVNEGRNSERCARDLQHLSYIHVPKVRWDLTSSRILVTEFVEAVKINDTDSIKNLRLSLKEIDEKLIEAMGYQIFQSGFVHADPHPGNVLVRKMNNKMQIVLLDHGLYQYIDEKTRTALSMMWKAIVLQDFKSMRKYAKDLQVQDPEIFGEILTQRPVKTGGFILTTKITEEQLVYMTEQARHRFDKIMMVLKDMPRSLLLVVRNLNTIRSIVHDHGDPVDRYTILARCATKISFENKTSWQKIIGIPQRLWFEIKLITGKLWIHFVKKSLQFLQLIGRSPDTSILVADLN